MKRPDLDSLTVPKGGDAAMSPSATSDSAQPKGYSHTLSLRLTSAQYRRLRRFVAESEERTDRRITHQMIIETALSEYLDRAGG